MSQQAQLTEGHRELAPTIFLDEALARNLLGIVWAQDLTAKLPVPRH